MNVHSADWHAARRLGLGGSDANTLMNGTSAQIVRLWKEKRGEVEPEDLSHALPVQMGVATEALNRAWFTQSTGRAVTEHPQPFVSPEHPFMRCNVDGLTDNGKTVFEAKHRSWRFDLTDSVQRYAPQLTHNMICAGVSRAVLSVFFGTEQWDFAEMELDPFYAEALIEREAAFWRCVETGEAPAEMEPVAAPVPPEKWRTVDMTGSNEWADAAYRYARNADAARIFKTAEKDLKALMAPDIWIAHGHGIEIKRSKNGALRIKETA